MFKVGDKVKFVPLSNEQYYEDYRAVYNKIGTIVNIINNESDDYPYHLNFNDGLVSTHQFSLDELKSTIDPKNHLPGWF